VTVHAITTDLSGKKKGTGKNKWNSFDRTVHKVVKSRIEDQHFWSGDTEPECYRGHALLVQELTKFLALLNANANCIN
jgi:hypothetical protein